MSTPAESTTTSTPETPVPASVPASPPAPPPLPEEEPLTPELLEDEAIRGDFVLRWLVVLMALLFGLTQIAESPTLVHVKTGQYLLGHGILPPRTDVFSYTANERPWVNLSWGFDLLLAGVYALGGWTAVSLLKPLLAAIAFGFAVHTAKPRLPTWWTALCVAIAVVACHKRFVALPYAITFIGLGIVLWQLERWRQAQGTSKKVTLWPLVGVFLVWANLDPRMFFGLGVLILWGLGDLVAASVNTGTASTPEGRRHYWQAVGASVAATLVHPFLWNPLLGAKWLYGADYPAQRNYLDAFAKAFDYNLLKNTYAQGYFSLVQLDPGQYDVATWCGLAVLVLALVTIALNYFKELGHLFVLIGCTFAGGTWLQDLPAAAFVAAVIAGLNGQAWFGSAFTLDYRVTFWNVAWSRGGRAVTVLAIAAVAFFGGTGRLRSPLMGRTGWNLDAGVRSQIDDLATQLKDSFDDRPFHVNANQGDILIWNGKKVFTDNRLALYYGTGTRNLFIEQLRTRVSLTGQAMDRSRSATSMAGEWKKTFDAYNLTHVVPRLSGEPIDYLMAVYFQAGKLPFQLTQLGGTGLVYYRTDLKDPRLKAYLKSHEIDFLVDAYRKPPPAIEPRTTPARSPDFYERYFWSRRRSTPLEIQEARHLVALAGLVSNAGDAMLYLAIRKAQLGLDKDPDSAEGYLALGKAYMSLLMSLEEPLSPMVPVQQGKGAIYPPTSVRYFQAVGALNEAITANPESMDTEPHEFLLGLYLGTMYRRRLQQNPEAATPEFALRPDLVLREYEALKARLPETERRGTKGKEYDRKIKQFKAYRDEVIKAFSSIKTDTPEGLGQLAHAYVSAGFMNLALATMNLDPDPAQNPHFRQIRPVVLLETGDVGTAYELLREYDTPAIGGVPAVQMAPLTCVTKTMRAEYSVGEPKRNLAADVARQSAQFVESQAGTMLLNGLALRPAGDQAPWPLSELNASDYYFHSIPELMGNRWLDAGLFHLEAGQFADAEACFRTVLRVNPDAPYPTRALIAHYITRMTGSNDIDPFPESEKIPLLHEDSPPDGP